MRIVNFSNIALILIIGSFFHRACQEGTAAFFLVRVIVILYSGMIGWCVIRSQNYKEFARTFGIDVEISRLQIFAQKTKNRDNRVIVLQMSAEEMGFPNEKFDVITAIEVIEHIPNLNKALGEIKRLLKPGGLFCITCPNRLFPFETHGIRWQGKEIGGRFPLLPYIPWLHSRLALARVFTLNDLDNLLLPMGFRRKGVDFAFPTFERGSRIGQAMRPFRNFMRFLERTPLRIFGVSIVVCYQKAF